ncbi:gluconate 2-dehydrogenase subunit 3 family protein [Paracoccus suum]|uniref:gluconate 2-dehydrogenase subunit 3 family protein n=1 Tax=Paracoccus suum TaxID=2259340 RepID=UPI0018F02BD8|nr:gluconate 2-dehydrogenase subunit 3 family protein [Paracoccus suum]
MGLQLRQADAPNPPQTQDYKFFTAAELAFVEAATERLIPRDELGPGARDCGVALFIDHQLAGDYGRAASWYMHGPWQKGQDTQGYQSRMNPSTLYRSAIKAINDQIASQKDGKLFAALAPEEQDQVISVLENGRSISQVARALGAGMSGRFAIRSVRAALACMATLAFGTPALAETNDFAKVARGRYLVDAGDCAACHTADNGKPFAGDRPIATP